MRFLKGHGTGNDFVLLPDPDGALHLGAPLVRALCDRRHGLGADGVLRVVRTAAAPEVAHLAGQAEWFMDYRNADGSLAEMCGNGVRVYARYLVESRHVAPGEHAFATRGGVRTVSVPESGEVTVDMGPPVRLTLDATVTTEAGTWSATAVSMGNPHLVCRVDDPADAGTLLGVPRVSPADAFPDGTNVEFVAVRPDGSLAMRVHERGVGETQSCGTGACAAAVAAFGWSGAQLPAETTVEVPGGRLRVRWERDTVLLTGPAVLVAAGELRDSWLAAVAASGVVDTGRNPMGSAAPAVAPSGNAHGTGMTRPAVERSAG